MEGFRRSLLQAPKGENNGEIVANMKKFALQPATNDGEHSYTNTRITPKQSPPFGENEQFELSLCSNNFDITEFENSYVHLVLRIRFDFIWEASAQLPEHLRDIKTHPENLTDLENDLVDNQYVFIGFKASTHCVGSYSFKFHDIPLSSTQQSQAITEQFLYTTFKSKGQLANKKYVYSPYQEVHDFKNSVCGIYIPLREILTNDAQTTYHEMEIIMPYQEFIILQDFDEYPNCVFGDLKMVFQIVPHAMVYTEVNPIKSIRAGILSGKIQAYKPANAPAHAASGGEQPVIRTTDSPDKVGTYAAGMTTVLALDEHTLPYSHAFQQINISDHLCFITGVDGDKVQTWAPTGFRPRSQFIQVKEAYVDCRGYKATATARQSLYQFFCTNPFTVVAQKVSRTAFPTAPQATQTNSIMNIRIQRCTDAAILMPTNSGQLTVFSNPNLKNFQLQIGNINFPNQPIYTASPEYLQQQMQQSDFDSIFEAPDEYEDSITNVRVDERGWRLPITDDTCFVPIISFERANAGQLVFDGIDSENEKVEIRGQPDNNTYNLYYQNNNVVDERGNYGTVSSAVPPPIFCTCTDTYWIFRIRDGHPNAQYITTVPYNVAYADASIECVNVNLEI